jgi:hypothetical protein
MPDKSIAEKLNISPDKSVTIFNPPKNSGEMLDGISETIAISEGDPADILLAFIDGRRPLKRNMLALKSNIKEDGALWIAYPVNDSNVTLERGFIAAYALKKGLREISFVPMNEKWAAVQLKISD